MKSRLSKLAVATSVFAAALGPNTGHVFAEKEDAAVRSGSPFIDLAQLSAEQRQTILEAAELGLMTGGKDGRFRPQSTLTRQELAVLLTRILDLKVEEKGVYSFKDVTDKTWGRGYIEAAAKAGLMKGDKQKRFRADAPVTRQELAAVLVQAAKNAQTEAAVPTEVADEKTVGTWAKKAVQTVLAHGWMETDNGSFLPKQTLKRQEIAGILMETFYPDKRTGVTRTIQNVSDRGVTINGYTYAVSERTKGILSGSNKAILQGAKIRFTASGRSLEKITYLELRNGGTAAKKGAKEFSANLLLDGKLGVVDGNVKVADDYVSLANVTVTGDLEIGKELENDFYGSSIEVRGKTIVNGGDSNTVVFEGSNLAAVDVNKSEVRVEALGQTFVQSMNVTADASIVGAPTAAIDRIHITGAARQVDLQGSLSSVNVSTGSTITGTANIGQLTVQTSSPVTLNTTGTISNLNVASSSAAVTLGAKLAVGSLSTPAGVAAGSVISNYPTAQTQIGSGGAATPTVSGPANSTPVVRNPIKDFTMTIGEKSTIDLSKVFYDVDGNLSYYKALLVKAASAPELVTVAIDGNQLTIEAKQAGKITVRTQAYDSNNARVNHDFAITVNRNPEVSDIPEQFVTLNAAANTLDLNTYFTDPDGDALTYESVSGDPAIVKDALSGSQLQMQALDLGKTSITVTAKDGRGGKAVKEIIVRVNRSPEKLDGLTDRKASVGTDVQVDLSNAFRDPDGDELAFEAAAQNASSASASVNGSVLTLVPLAEGPVSVTVTAKDGKGGTASQTFTLNVNRSPKADQPVDAQEAMVGKGDIFVELAGMFSDEDGDPLTYDVRSAAPAIASAGLTADDRIRVSPLAGGETTVTVTADDGRGGKKSADFKVRVNEAPTVLKPVGARFIQLTGGAVTVDLSGIFHDMNDDKLTLTAKSADPALAKAEASGTQLTLTPIAAGSTSVELTADDGRGGQVSDTFNVRINQAPKSLTSFADQLLTLGTGEKTISLNGAFSDLDGDALTYKAVSADPSVAAVSLSGSEIKVDPLAAGTTTVTVTASDGYEGETSKTFEVTVNRPPIVAEGVQDRLVTLGTGDDVVDLSRTFRDEDGDSLTLTASSLSESLASVALNNATGELTIRPLAGGTASIRIQADDGRGGVTARTFNVEINRAPQAGILADQTLSLGSLDKTIDLSGVFTDADGDNLILSVVSADPSVADAVVNGSQLTLTASALGNTNVTVTASDSRGGKASKTIAVGVQPNRAPVVDRNIARQMLQPGKAIELDLAGVFSDPDGDALSYQAVSADGTYASASVTGHRLTVNGIADGASVITVTAEDRAGNRTDTSFQVDVSSNQAPEVVGSAPEQIVVPGFPTQIAVDSLFRDSDGDSLTYSAEAAAGGVVASGVSGNMLKLAAGTGSGKTQVTVTADDGRGGKASTTIQVTSVEIVHQKTIATKIGVANVAYDLTPYFPGQQTLTLYRADSGALIKENAPVLSGSVLNMSPGASAGTIPYFVVSADGKAASVQLNVQQQLGAAAFFSEYSRENATNIVLETYNFNEETINYQIIGYRYNLKTGQMEKMLDRDYKPDSYARVNQIYKKNIGLVINNVFYEFMDRTQVPHYHDELVMNLDWNYKFDGYVVSAFELIKDGQVIDVIGDKNWTPASGSEPLPTNGTMIRKKGVTTGSNAFSLHGEWDLLPFTLDSVNKHTP
ncbi:Ig-like domain-containing protein [Saccharibacillus alkalitolerans]|uniref:RTX toxin n=1 Tax=Saccharibacillus alkalitolerans TaxID=2705290 RepID=A0ABX0F456_9BACL|nr:S-layer homology domain-containing protein [Saccharibacillus alkalitolerans]NGZ74689.1 RTX toxin [Saccharibacillus alkalitolerans]